MPTRIPRFDPAHGDRHPATLNSRRGDFPLRAVTVRARIAGTTAGVEVEQSFANPYDEALEVSYVFPLPELAAVTRCELVVSDRVVAARLDERAIAHAAFAEAVDRGRQAALAEQERPGVFTITLGNLAPRESATVRFAMAYPLPREDGRHVFRFPLVVAERYVPGAPLDDAPVGHGTHADTAEVADASRLTPPRLAPGAEHPVLEAEIVLNHGALGIHDVECSLHAVEQVRESGRRIVRLAAGQAMDRDLVVRFRLGGESIRSQLWIERDAAGDEGTFQLTVVPPPAPIRRRPRDVVLVLDRSGSMEGWKIVAARRALVRMIDTLDDADRFAAYAFSSETIASADLAFDRLHAATAGHRSRAAEFLQGVSAAGGTEMRHPLTLAIELLGPPDPARDRWIVLVTDGQVANEDALVALVSGAPEVKVQALGIDDAINSSLLRRLASATGGRVELVAQLSELEAALDRLHLLLASPALERVAIAADTILDQTVVPAGRLHAFPGVPLVVRGRYRGALRSLSVTAQGVLEPFALDIAAEPAALPALATCWAREQLLALEDRFAARAGDRDEIAAEIVRTSLRFGVLCRFTAFVAVDEHGPIARVAARHVQQPVEPTLARASKAIELRVPQNWRPPPDDTGASKTIGGTIKGKYHYMSPEQTRGRPVGPPHEVYTLGHLLWELLSGLRLIDAENDYQLLVQISRGVLPEPFLPPALGALEPALRRALDVDPERRHATPGAFADDIEAAVAPASSEEVAAWLATLGGELARRQVELRARIAGLHAPQHGYFVLERWATTMHATIYVAVRSGRRGPEMIALRRGHPVFLTGPSQTERFLSEVSLAIDGIAHTDDTGFDAAGNLFRAQPFVCGLDLAQVLGRIRRQHATPAPAIAVAVIGEAARALQRALTLPTSSGAMVSVIGKDLAPSSLRVGTDGRPVWTSLGVAPSADFLAPRRSHVPLVAAAGLDLDGLPRPPVEPLVGRSVVVPQSTVAATPATAPPSPPRSRRPRWWS